MDNKSLNKEQKNNTQAKKIIKTIIIMLFLAIILFIFILCTQPKYTKGLEFELSEERTSYVIVGIGTAKGTGNGRFDIVVPGTFDDLPVKSIANEAFYDCIGITSVTLPDSIISIGDYAFYCCENLESINLPDNVEEIGEMAFYGCEKLRDVTIPEKLTEIKEGTFWNCYNFKGITIPGNVKYIEKNAFLSTGLERITISEASIDIDAEAFAFCENLSYVSIINWPENVESNISTEAFFGCVNLEKIWVPGGYVDINNDEDDASDEIVGDDYDTTSNDDSKDHPDIFLLMNSLISQLYPNESYQYEIDSETEEEITIRVYDPVATTTSNLIDWFYINKSTGLVYDFFRELVDLDIYGEIYYN